MEELENLREKLGQLADDFGASPFMEKLASEKQTHASFIADTFVGYATNSVGALPEQWDAATINEVCLYYVPGKVSSEPAFFECYAEVLCLFFQFLKSKGILTEIKELESAANAIAKKIPKKAADPINWHMAKSMMMPAMESGLDLSNEEEMDNYMRLQQQQGLSGMLGGSSIPYHDPIKAPKKIGRNEKVDVKYEDGTVKKGIKYKKVKKDIDLGKCSII